MAMKRRLARIENKVNPPRYARIEDIITMLELEEREEPTPREEKLLVELKSMPVHPDLVQAFDKLKGSDKGGSCSEM